MKYVSSNEPVKRSKFKRLVYLITDEGKKIPYCELYADCILQLNAKERELLTFLNNK